jgi:hypothetical protein
MPELKTKGTHAVGGGSEILQVDVFQGNRLLLATYAPNKVTVSGAKAHLTVTGNGRGVQISTDENLNDATTDSFSRYETDDPSILRVQIDDIAVDTSKATPVKVDIYL